MAEAEGPAAAEAQAEAEAEAAGRGLSKAPSHGCGTFTRLIVHCPHIKCLLPLMLCFARLQFAAEEAGGGRGVACMLVSSAECWPPAELV